MTDRAQGTWNGWFTINPSEEKKDVFYETIRIAEDGTMTGGGTNGQGKAFTVEGKINTEDRTLVYTKIVEGGPNVPHDGQINEAYNQITGAFRVEGTELTGTYELNLQ